MRFSNQSWSMVPAGPSLSTINANSALIVATNPAKTTSELASRQTPANPCGFSGLFSANVPGRDGTIPLFILQAEEPCSFMPGTDAIEPSQSVSAGSNYLVLEGVAIVLPCPRERNKPVPSCSLCRINETLSSPIYLFRTTNSRLSLRTIPRI